MGNVNSEKDIIHSDVQSEQSAQDQSLFASLESVGMSNIQLSLQHQSGLLIPARADLFVNLRMGRRGIHMSRIYELMLSEMNQKSISEIHFGEILKKMVNSQDGDSNEAKVQLCWDEICEPKSLKSNRIGTRVYPVQLEAKCINGIGSFLNLHFEVLYSSTCPQSLALSQELTQNLKSESATYVATPHAQRSRMKVTLQFNLELKTLPLSQFSVAQGIELVETALKTPVQTVVKKADEMEFARLNAENPMFCEDAVRLVARELQKQQSRISFSSLKITARHEESLHAHDAVATLKSTKFIQF